MRRFAVALLVASCSPQSEVVDAAPPVVKCCTPSDAPECCMQLGGVQIDNQCDLTCNLPDPATSGWMQTVDGFGCPIWKRPEAPFGCAGSDAAISCSPGDTTSFSPTGLAATRSAASSCTKQELSDFYAACLGPASVASSCYATRQAAPSCASCLLSQHSDSTWGAIVTTSTVWELNVAGCTALATGDTSTTGCAARIAAAMACEDFACDNCPFTPGSTTTSRAQCTQSADVAACRAYVDSECDAADAGYSACRVNLESSSSFVSFASVFCSP